MFGSANVALIPERRIDIKNYAELPFEVAGGFMDIIELKRTDVPFWTQSKGGQPYLYRGKYLVPHHELRGAIALAEHYILQAEKQVDSADFRKTHGIVPLKPRGIVVHGRSDDWKESEWEAFRLLNDSLHGIEVITFDHLLAQARRSIELT